MLIRRAKPNDADCITACISAAYRPYINRMGGNSLPPMTVNYAQEIEESEVWVAEEKELIGVMVLSESDNTFNIANIAVHPNFQGQGVGKKLINFAVQEAIKRKKHTIDLITHPLLEENLSLYTYLGWIETKRDSSHVYMARCIK